MVKLELVSVGIYGHLDKRASLVAQRLKHLPAMRETWDRSLGWEDPLETEMAGESHGRRSLVGYSLLGCKESDMTERLHFHRCLSCPFEVVSFQALTN